MATIQEIHNKLRLPSSRWSDQTSSSNHELRLCKLGDYDGNNVVIQSLVVQNDFTWSLKVHGVAVDGERCPSLNMFANRLSDRDINRPIEHLDKLQVCPGHPDSHFIELANAKGGFKSTNGKTKAFLDSAANVTLNGETYSSTTV